MALQGARLARTGAWHDPTRAYPGRTGTMVALHRAYLERTGTKQALHRAYLDRTCGRLVDPDVELGSDRATVALRSPRTALSLPA